MASRALGRYAVPAEVLDGHPCLDAVCRDLFETAVQFCVLIGREGGVAPAEDDAARRFPDPHGSGTSRLGIAYGAGCLRHGKVITVAQVDPLRACAREGASNDTTVIIDADRRSAAGP